MPSSFLSFCHPGKPVGTRLLPCPRVPSGIPYGFFTKSLALVKNCLNSLATSFTLVRIPYTMSAYEYILGPRAKFGVACCHRLWPSHGRLTLQRGSSVLERSSEGRSRRHARRHARRQAPTHEAPHSHAHTRTHPRTHAPTHPRTHAPTLPRSHAPSCSTLLGTGFSARRSSKLRSPDCSGQ